MAALLLLLEAVPRLPSSGGAYNYLVRYKRCSSGQLKRSDERPVPFPCRALHTYLGVRVYDLRNINYRGSICGGEQLACPI